MMFTCKAMLHNKVKPSHEVVGYTKETSKLRKLYLTAGFLLHFIL